MSRSSDREQTTSVEGRRRVGRFSQADEEKMRAWMEKNLPPMSAAGMEQVMRAIRCLNQPTQAGAERRAIFALLMKHEGVQDTVLYRCCSKKFDVRIREMQKAGVEIARWAVDQPNGDFRLVYGLPAFKLWQARELMEATAEKVESLKRVV